jgi:hypothetical protein
MLLKIVVEQKKYIFYNNNEFIKNYIILNEKRLNSNNIL